jgi:hypothetical protein
VPDEVFGGFYACCYPASLYRISHTKHNEGDKAHHDRGDYALLDSFPRSDIRRAPKTPPLSPVNPPNIQTNETLPNRRARGFGLSREGNRPGCRPTGRNLGMPMTARRASPPEDKSVLQLAPHRNGTTDPRTQSAQKDRDSHRMRMEALVVSSKMRIPILQNAASMCV